MAPKKTKAQLNEASLKRRWYSPGEVAAYGGFQPLKEASKLPSKSVQDWLKGQEAYTLHRTIKRRFQRRRVVVRGIDDQ